MNDKVNNASSDGLLAKLERLGSMLLVAAAEREASSLLGGHPVSPWQIEPVGERSGVLRCGVGKANAAGAVAAALASQQYAGVLSVGVGGVLPGGALAIGEALAGSRSVFADEGITTPSGFSDVAAMGFPPIEDAEGVGFDPDPKLLDAARSLGVRAGPIATVSTCSGADAAARAVRDRTGAWVEAMEGAAVALVCRRMGVAFLEVRVVSNTTGDRAGQVWDLPLAFERLGALVGGLIGGTPGAR
ncbi:MAG: futalosine hydrolase [Planctomycetota bacterium]